MITETDINAIASRIETVLRDIAVPKPSRVSEHYAALTLSIVLLREQCIDENTPKNRKMAVGREIATLIQKRAALEEVFEAADETIGDVVMAAAGGA